MRSCSFLPSPARRSRLHLTDTLPQDPSRHVVTLHGFGACSRLSAVYLAGKRVALLAEESEDCAQERAFEALAHDLAALAGLGWLERTAAACWRYAAAEVPPDTLDDYCRLTETRFRSLTREAVLSRWDLPPLRGPQEELDALRGIYLLAGADPLEFDDWRVAFANDHEGPFSERKRLQLQAYRGACAAGAARQAQVFFDELYDDWAAYAALAWACVPPRHPSPQTLGGLPNS